MTTFVDQRVIVSQVTAIKVGGGTKETKVQLFDGLASHWPAPLSSLSDTDLGRDTSIKFKQVTIDGISLDVKEHDEVELFNVKGVSLGLFVITDADPMDSPKGRATNTFMKVRTKDG